jgi:malonate transporter and related proteins
VAKFAQLLFPDFSLILLGFLVCRYTALNRAVWEKVESLVYYFLFPVLLFQSIVKNPLDLGEVSSLIVAGLLLLSIAIGMAYGLPYLPVIGRHIDRRDHAASVQVAFRFNSFILLALGERMAGVPGQQLIAVLIGVSVPLGNVAAVWPMARQGQVGVVRALLANPLVVTTVLALAANLLGFRIPEWLEPTVSRIGAASLAMGLMAAGAGLQLTTLAMNKALTVGVLAIRHFLLPLVALALSLALRLDAVQTAVLLAFSALPTSSSTFVLASRMGYNGAYVAGLVTLSTLLSLASLPFALQLAQLWKMLR